MKRMKKTFAVLLTAALLLTVFAVCAFAADSAVTGITVATPPTRTVYYVGGDDYGTEIWCDPAGMVLTVSYEGGTTAEVDGDSEFVDMTVYDYTVGENSATVSYYDEVSGEVFTAETPVTVLENPIQSVEITKMPVKTEYDLEKDVLTKENFSIDRLYEFDAESFDAALAEMGITFEEYKELVTDADLAEILFADTDAILLIDPTGIEILVTYTDGATEVVTSEDDYITHLGYLYPISVAQKANTVTEGNNTLSVFVMGKSADFDVTVKRAANTDNTNTGNTGSTNTDVKDDIKNPDIPKTGMTAGITAAAVLMLSGTAGSVLLLRRKEDK
ncbi:MAG: LPXTG cell wall anchor domain-containing protein [Clostridia bacterium]|nr:LPXTG cell wall anchor domain-containing protein [Clostridia bacterium]